MSGSALNHDLAALAPIGPLTDWLDANVPELGKGPLQTALLSGGTSNVVLTLDRGKGPTMVLRRPPAVPPPGAERGVMREARVLTALNGTQVPHPHCFGVCEDPEVIGRPFYVMEMVDGWAGNLRGEKIYNEAPFDRMPYEYGLNYAIVGGLIQRPMSITRPSGWKPSASPTISWSARSIAGPASSRAIRKSTRATRRAISKAMTRSRPGCARTRDRRGT